MAPYCHESTKMSCSWISIWPTMDSGWSFLRRCLHSTGAQTREKNNQLLSHVVDRLTEGAKGYRFIGGDFNHFVDDLSIVQSLTQQGWEEAQHIALRKFEQPIQPTIQHKHTKDLLFLSPELSPLVKEVHVESDWFANHAIVYTVLQAEPPQMRVPIWKQPRPVDWPDSANTDSFSPPVGSLENPSPGTEKCALQEQANQRYRNIWSSFENQMTAHAKNDGTNIHGSQTRPWLRFGAHVDTPSILCRSDRLDQVVSPRHFMDRAISMCTGSNNSEDYRLWHICIILLKPIPVTG